MGIPVGSIPTGFKNVKSCHCPGIHSLQTVSSHPCTKMLITQSSPSGMLFSPGCPTVEARLPLPVKLAPALCHAFCDSLHATLAAVCQSGYN